MWPPDLGPADVQPTPPGFGSVFEDVEDRPGLMSSGGYCQSTILSGGLGMCCVPSTSLSLSCLSRDLSSLRSSKNNGPASTDKNSTQTFNCYPQPSISISYMLTSCATSTLSSSSSSSSLYLTSPSTLSDALRTDNETSEQQQKLQEEYHSIKEEPADEFLPCTEEQLQFNNQQGALFLPRHVYDGVDRTPLCSPRLNGPTGPDSAVEQQDQQCHWIDCSATYSSQEELVRHIEKTHIDQRKGEEFACFWAGCVRRRKPFNARYKLLIHMRVHSGEKPNKCMVRSMKTKNNQSVAL